MYLMIKDYTSKAYFIRYADVPGTSMYPSYLAFVSVPRRRPWYLVSCYSECVPTLEMRTVRKKGVPYVLSRDIYCVPGGIYFLKIPLGT